MGGRLGGAVLTMPDGTDGRHGSPYGRGAASRTFPYPKSTRPHPPATPSHASFMPIAPAGVCAIPCNVYGDIHDHCVMRADIYLPMNMQYNFDAFPPPRAAVVCATPMSHQMNFILCVTFQSPLPLSRPTIFHLTSAIYLYLVPPVPHLPSPCRPFPSPYPLNLITILSRFFFFLRIFRKIWGVGCGPSTRPTQSHPSAHKHQNYIAGSSEDRYNHA